MSGYVAPNICSRKHKRSGLDTSRSKKRVRLDAMLESLSLDGPKGEPTPVYINPLAIPEQSNKRKKPDDIDSIISGKIYESYKHDLLRGLQLIRYMHPVAVLIWRFQAWVKRLFNVFIRKFNRKNPSVRPMKMFRDYLQIMALVENPMVNFTLAELLHIVIQESRLEVRAIARKREKSADSAKLEEIKDEEDAAKECNYKYWDRLRTQQMDVEMEATSGSESAADMDMDMDEHLEANYGNYYTQSM